MTDAIEFSSDNGDEPITLTIDTNLTGSYLLARLCQFLYEVETEDSELVLDIYGQILDQISYLGHPANFDDVNS